MNLEFVEGVDGLKVDGFVWWWWMIKCSKKMVNDERKYKIILHQFESYSLSCFVKPYLNY